MKRSWPVPTLVVLCLAFAPAFTFGQSEASAVAAATTGTVSGASVPTNAAPFIPDTPDVPLPMLELMRNAEQRYLEGSNLIKMGDSARARAAFNSAVDLLLRAEWDISTTPALNRFFNDLIRRIQEDESKYTTLPETAEEKPEQAVVDELDALDLIPITVDPKLQDVVEADLKNTRYDIPVTLNEKVLKSLDFWLTRGRKFFNDGLVRSGRYRDMIQRIFKEESVPLDVMYLAQVESLFKTNALSRTQNKGIWQFGKWTAIRYGLKVNSYIDERSDPEKSTRAAARYLNDLYGMFKDWNLVLAAYNWGEAKVQKLIERSGVNDFWDLMDLRKNFPEETKNHVPLIMASVILAKNPAKYGFPTELDEPLDYDQVPVSKAIDLRSAAKILNTSLDQLKQLNPALRGMSTPADYPDFALKVPAGSDPSVATQLAALPAVKFKPPPEYGTTRHRVHQGETLARIASQYRVSVAELQRMNNIRSAKSVRVGSYLTVPRRASARSKNLSTSTRSRSRVATSRIKTTIKAAPIRGASSSFSKPTSKSKRTSASRISASKPKNSSRPAGKSVKSSVGVKKGRPTAEQVPASKKSARRTASR
jgi:membrane-bound lytic murein transglycosylase D